MGYVNHKVNISEAQRKRLERSNGNDVTIKLGHDDLQGDDLFAFTRAQMNKMEKAYENGTGVSIKMSPTQVKANIRMTGGFLGMLAGLASKVLLPAAKMILPALGMGALSGAASSGVQKLMGSGLYLKKGGSTATVEMDGRGLYLTKYRGKGIMDGDGLYLKRGSQMVRGEGLILGPNSPFKNIPLLGMIL